MTRLTEELVVNAEDQLLAAMKASDTAALDTLLHNDLLFITPGGQTITKVMDLDAHQSGNMVISQLTRTFENIRIIDDTAVVTLVLDTKGLMLNQPIEGRFRYIRVWKLFNGRLKVIGGSCMQVK